MTRHARPVVVGIGGHQPSALRFALRSARAARTWLRVVHSTGVSALHGGVRTAQELSQLHHLRREGEALLEGARRLVESDDPAADAQYVLSDRPPLPELLAQGDGARALVVGSDHVPWFERLIRARIAGHLALQASCPVYIVPEREVPPQQRDGDVVVALDGETSPSGPLRLGFDEASTRDSMLHVLHAVPRRTGVTSSPTPLVGDVVAGWRERYPDVMVLEALVTDAPEAELAQAARGADLVVVGRSSRRELTLALSKPITRGVLGVARCPVAVVPPGYRGF